MVVMMSSGVAVVEMVFGTSIHRDIWVSKILGERKAATYMT